ncbi:MAG: hypothetical protein EPN82_12410 [Bacteroidetes bacterium]|nr:MAG: hypothetical protein EPN82_12410 [Bacteroidota bacterium]
MALFVKYIAAIISSFSLLFSTTGVSLLHHLCLHTGNQEVTLLYENINKDECGNDYSCCSDECEIPNTNQPSYTELDCCKDFSDYAVISVAYISQQIEKFSSDIGFNQEFFANNVQRLLDNSENNILVKPPGILKQPISSIISYILHSTDISSDSAA